jgi:hypothetical protein
MLSENGLNFIICRIDHQTSKKCLMKNGVCFNSHRSHHAVSSFRVATIVASISTRD